MCWRIVNLGNRVLELNKPLYIAISFYSFIVSLLMKLGVVIAAGYSLLHFNENPPVISIVVVICLAVFIFYGNDEVKVYNDKVVLKTTSLFGAIFNLKPIVFEIKDIKQAYIQPSSDGPLELSTVIFLRSFLNTRRSNSNKIRFYLELNNGETRTIFVDLEVNQVKKVIELINSLTRS